MTQDTSYPHWLLTRWKALLGLCGIVALVLGVTAASVTSWTSQDFSLQAMWPARLSADAPSKLPVVLSRWNDADLSGTMTLYRGWTPARRDFPRAMADGEMEKLAEGTLDQHGAGVLDIPPVKSMPPPPEEDGLSPALLLHVHVDGEDRWFEHQLEQLDAPVLAVMLDRPLYQPGQTIKMRGLVASATTGRPRNTKVRFVVHDAKSNLVMDEEKETGANGVAATQLQLADRCVQGSYTVEISAGGQTKTRNVDVRPFRLPRFKVTVKPLSSLVKPGESLPARVEAMYTYGEPLDGAEVTVESHAGAISLPDIAGKTDATGGFDVELSIPRNASAGAAITLSATVTSVAGRAEVGAATSSVAGRSALVELVPARQAQFVSGQQHTAYAIVSNADGSPIVGATVVLILPEHQGERTVTLTTDARGRAVFQWQPDTNVGSYASVEVKSEGMVLFKQNIHPAIGYGDSSLRVAQSVTDVGAVLDIQITPAQTSGIVTLSRDGVTVAAVTAPAKSSALKIKVPSGAAGFADVALMRGNGVEHRLPIWIRQRGGDHVEIELDQAEYRPGTQAKVTLSFEAGKQEKSDQPPVTFGLVGVDEALYALKERAGVPLYVLMRRSPTSIVAALGAFDGINQDSEADVDIATHRFRASLSGYSASMTGASELTDDFDRYSRAGWLMFLFFVWSVGLLAVVIQMGRWTWSATSTDAFSWRRLFAQIGFGVLCGLFASILGAASEQTWVGGLSVWMVVVGCWLVAAAARLPDLPFTRWLAAHVLGLAFLGALGICFEDLGPEGAVNWLLGVGLAVPVSLAVLQWLVWAFVLMGQGLRKPGLGIASFVGIFTIGLTGSLVAVKYDREMAPVMAPMMEAVADGFREMPESKKMRRSALPMSPPPPPGQAAGGGAPVASPRLRSWFPETMVWLPQINSDDAGKATIDVELPDSITTWRLDAWANTVDGRFGQGQTQLLAVQPYFVELDVPVEVIDGDRFEVPVTLVNRSDAPLTVEVNAEVEGPLALRGARGGSPQLQPGQRTTMWLSLAAVGVGNGAITVRSTTDNDDAGDAVRRPLRIRPDGRVLRKSASGIVGKGWEAGLNIPRDAIEGTRFSEVRVFGSLVADALGGLESMLGFPTGCFEQTSSANYPNIMVLRAMRDMKPSDWPDGEEEFLKVHERATRLVRVGYQNMLGFQRADGGFALYPDRYESSVMLTAYGILQLVWAKEVTSVDPEVIRRAANWLAAQQRDDGSWPGGRAVSGSGNYDDDIGLARSTAFVVMALVATKDANLRPAVDKALVRLEKRIDSIESANALAFVANALADAGSKKLALKAVDRLAAMAVRKGQLAHWTDAHPTWMGGVSAFADRETTALATQALLATESQADLMQPALSWIASNRGSWGGWGSTQATVWTLRTLETLRSKSSSESTLRFSFDSEPLPTVAGATELKVTKTPQPLRQFSFVPGANEGRFRVDASAETSAMVQLVTEYAVDWDSRWAEVDEEPFGGELEIEERRTKRGSATRAYARIENLLETDATMVIVEVPVPPGAFVPSDALDDLVRNGAVDTYEVLPTHIRFYVNAVPGKQERVFAYDFVPLVRGTFSLPPLRAYPFYSPEPITEVDAGDIAVR